MRAKQMLATMSHEIRSPLSGVVSMTEILSTTKLDKEQRQLLDVMLSSGDLVLQLINDILDLSKVESGTRFIFFFLLKLYQAWHLWWFISTIRLIVSILFRSNEVGSYTIPTERSRKACTPDRRSFSTENAHFGRACRGWCSGRGMTQFTTYKYLHA